MNTTTTTNNKYNTGRVTMAHETSNNGASDNPIASIVNTQFPSTPKAGDTFDAEHQRAET
jgi:hypothetical protein